MDASDECLWEKEKRSDGYLVYRAKIKDSFMGIKLEAKKECWARNYLHPDNPMEICRRCLENCPVEHREKTSQIDERGEKKAKWNAGTYRKKNLIEERGPFCERCGEPQGQRDDFLEVHHRNKDRDDNRPANLSLLCKTCHDEVHDEKDTEFLDLTEEELFDLSEDQGQLDDF